MVQVQSSSSIGDELHSSTSKAPFKIMVVEDSLPLLEAMTLTLESEGYHVIRATDGLEALDQYERESPDLVILDLKLPVVTGFRLLRIFKGNIFEKKVPVIVVTAMDFEEAEEVAEAGADDFLSKPFDLEHLGRKVSFLLQRSTQASLGVS